MNLTGAFSLLGSLAAGQELAEDEEEEEDVLPARAAPQPTFEAPSALPPRFQEQQHMDSDQRTGAGPTRRWVPKAQVTRVAPQAFSSFYFFPPLLSQDRRELKRSVRKSGTDPATYEQACESSLTALRKDASSFWRRESE